MTIQVHILATLRRLGRVRLAAIRAALPGVNYNTLRGALRRLRDQGLASLENGVYEAVAGAEAPAPFDPAAILRAAWAQYWSAPYECTRKALAKGFMPERLRNCLRHAWGCARAERAAAIAAPAEKAERLRGRILRLENKDVWEGADWRAMAAMRLELRALEGRAPMDEPELPLRFAA